MLLPEPLIAAASLASASRATKSARMSCSMSGVDQGADELSAGALHAGDDGADVISSGTIKVGRDADVLLRRSWVQG